MSRLDKYLKKRFQVELGVKSQKYHRRIMYDREERDPYLARFYLTFPPTMPDGSDPFDEFGRPKPGIIWHETRAGLTAYLHYFYRGDSDECLHNHPWHYGISLILTGGYREERRMGDFVISRTFKPGMVNIIRDDDFHRVDLLKPDSGCWSLFIAGPKTRSWGFWDRNTGEFTNWVEFIRRKRERK